MVVEELVIVSLTSWESVVSLSSGAAPGMMLLLLLWIAAFSLLLFVAPGAVAVFCVAAVPASGDVETDIAVPIAMTIVDFVNFWSFRVADFRLY